MLIACVGITFVSSAQSYTLVPDDSVLISGMLEDQQTLTIEQHNTTSNSIQLAWAKVSENVPALWDAYVCDNTFCYAALEDSGTMQPCGTGSYGFLLIHFTPHVNYGTAVVRYAVWDVTTPNLKDTLSFILDVTNTGIYESENEKLFSIYPNPATDYINIKSDTKENFSVDISNSAGENIYKSNNNSDQLIIGTKLFAKGTYFIQLSTSTKKICRTILIH